ncbi:hypothetical protein ACFPOE_11070 [Caenimonas terrae]|uniref:Uncharacterized protein n=1 Tax=Caenimonas terrae TaxID=696074 RepID=A0ABW0NBN4_9BURK
MRTWKPTIQSLFGLLGGAQRATRELDDAIGEIQDAMLEALGETGMKRFPAVSRRIQYAPDLQALWYLRGDLMAALSALHGEGQARDMVQDISEQFGGLLPRGMSTRPSPLGK